MISTKYVGLILAVAVWIGRTSPERGSVVGIVRWRKAGCSGGAILQQWPGHHVRAKIAGRPLWEDGTRVAMDNCW